jgi:hypothetical protein
MSSSRSGPREDIQGVLIQEIPGARVVQQMKGDADMELASGLLKVLLVTLDISDPFHDSQSEGKQKATETVE